MAGDSGGGMRPMGQRSGAVTAVAIINYILGGLSVLCGILLMVAFTMFASLLGGAAAEAGKNDPRAAEAAGGLMGMFAGMGVVLGACMLVFSAIYIFAGYGVMNRKQWGRILTLVLGALAGLGAVFALFSIGKAPGSAIMQIAINGGYCAFVYITLLNSENAAEFS